MDALLTWEGWGAITLSAVWVGLVAALGFVISYQLKVGLAWWRHQDGSPNPFGRFLMSRKALLAVLFVVVLLNRYVPGWTAREMITALLMSCFALQTFVPYRLLMKAQHEAEATVEGSNDDGSSGDRGTPRGRIEVPRN